MSQKCDGCNIDIPPNTAVRIDEKRFCTPCAENAMAGLQAKNVCTQCGIDFGSMPLARVGGASFCEKCRGPLYAHDFPGWLKGAFAALSIALVFAVYHALPYFRAGRDYYHAEKLYEQHRYAEAIPGFEAALKIGPDAKEIRLRLALAYLKDGAPSAAYEKVKGISFESSEDFSEMQSYFDRFDKAWAKFDEARKLADDNHSKEAAQKVREAKAIYPELQGVDEQIEELEIGAAYERKDYDAFLKLSDARWKRQPTSEHAAGLASALACRYAVSGDEAARTRSQAMLREAESLAKTDEEKQSFAEYRERIEYRLKTRNIIDRREYDRRFRPQQKEAS